MLRRAASGLFVLAVVVTAGPSVAGEDDGTSYFIKERSHGIDLELNKPAEPADQGRVEETSFQSNGDRPLTVSDMLDALCTTTTGLTLDSMPDLNTPICLTLNAQGGDEPVDAAALAQTLRDRLDLATPEIHTSPQDPVKALVGLETWMWVPPGQWDVLTESGSLGGTTVTVRAEPVATMWDMGESTEVCSGPGRVWRKGLGQEAPTTCGYTYRHTSLKQPDNEYEIGGQIRYHATWTCEGNCSVPSGDLGTITSVASTASLEVSERHSVVIDP